MEKIKKALYDRDNKTVTFRLAGIMNEADIEDWKNQIATVITEIPHNTTFKAMVNLYGFKAENFEVHKTFRNIIPRLLADYGFRIGYLNMFPEVTVELQCIRGIRCVAVANVHNDEVKMKDYQKKFSKPNEQYFTDPLLAEEWLRDI